jgi:hypothetical protein
MTFTIWNLETGNLVDWFHSEEDAYAAVRRVVGSGRVDADAVGLRIEDEQGHSVGALQGPTLLDAARSANIS